MNLQANFCYTVLLPHAHEPRLLMIATPTGYALPQWQTATPPFWQTTNYVNATIQASYGLTVTTLRCVALLDDDARQEYSRIYALENHSPDWTPRANSRWISAAELDNLAFAQPEHRSLLSAWFSEALHDLPVLRRPWARPGWFGAASNWINQVLADHDLQPIEQPEQLRNWERSCVLRISTACQTFFFKVLPARFAHELSLIAALAEHHPANGVRLLAVEPHQHWLLMQDFAAPTLDTLVDPAAWQTALAQLAELQIATVAQTEHLLALGCPDLRVDRIVAALDPFFADLERYPYLTSAEIAALRQRVPQFKQACAQLRSSAIPAALEHGDLGPWNIALRADTALFFDWTDASISHPFFGLVLLLAELPSAIRTDPEQSERLLTTYLSPWTVFAPLAEVRAAWTLAAQIAPLQHALFYHLHILPGLEAEWEMINMVTVYLKMLL